MISVAMTTYNSARFILEQVESIQHQNLKVDEVVICDDCSVDNTVQILENFIKENGLITWKLYLSDSNQGFIKTFSKAIKLVCGDVIILCDHDDIWLPDKTEIIAKTFSQHPSVMALATSFVKIDENDCVIDVKKRWRHSNNNLIRQSVKRGSLTEISFKDVLQYNISPGCTCAMRKSIQLEYVKNDDDFPHDWKINLIASLLDGLYYLDVVTIQYRIYEGNTIGLTHQSQATKRKNVVKHSLIERNAMKNLVKRLVGERSNQFLDTCKIFDLFEVRYRFLSGQQNLFMVLLLLVKTMRFSALYESIFFDFYAVIRNNVKG